MPEIKHRPLVQNQFKLIRTSHFENDKPKIDVNVKASPDYI